MVTYSHVKLVIVWAESSFGLFLLRELIWFGSKWGKISTSLVLSGTTGIRIGQKICSLVVTRVSVAL